MIVKMNPASYVPVGLLSEPLSSTMQVPPSPSVGPSTGAEHQKFRLIPIHVRFVPKDIWIRMHVDTRSTIGSVKDALLEKLQIPPFDPSLHQFFYEDARAAMSRQNATQAEAKSFPKAFVARMPKRNAKEIRRAEREAEAASSSTSNSIHDPSSKLSKSLNIRKIPTIKQISTSAQARAILGGDAGIGGRGSMGFIGKDVEGKESKRESKNKVNVAQRPKVIGPPMRSRVISTQTTFSSSSDLAHPLSNSINASTNSPLKISVLNRSEQQSSTNDINFDPTRSAGLDAYADYYGFGLTGNEEAKRLEEAAMTRLRAMDTSLGEGSLGDTPALSSSPAKSSPSYADRTRCEDDFEDEPLDGQQAFDELVQYSGSITHSTSTPITEDSVSQLEQNTNSLVRRLAGINTDEISAWKDARHPQAKYYAVHSYSNGYIMEDWRTVAALRIRPFELFEIQYADPHEKVHLPRLGEANDASSGRADKGTLSKDKEEKSISGQSPLKGEFDQQSNSPIPALDNRYLEPFAEAWCYVFKRGGGTSKAQKAGLGLWKLRWISLRGRNLTVYRTKYLRQGYDEAMNIWNLSSVDSVISERADGVTRPVLVPITGQCQDILTLTFARATVIPNSIHDESSDYQQATLSMRFITQVDHCAFFRCFARAHFYASLQHQDPLQAAMVFEWRRKAIARSVIAGMGGTVVPGKAGRRGGRNALSRKRLRPPGMSREFDDADRWSSDSDGEDVPSTMQTASQQNMIGDLNLDADLTSEVFDSPASTRQHAQFVPEDEEQSPAAQAIHSFLAQRSASSGRITKNDDFPS